MAYFDNAATTFPKPECVYKAMDQFYRGNGASAARGEYSASISVNQIVAETRERIKRVLHCQAKQVVFTPTATLALNIIIQGLLQNDGKTVYITPLEHNAVTRVLHHFEKKGTANVIQLCLSKDLHYDINVIRKQFSERRPDILIMTHASNVCGLVTPVEEISVVAKEYGAVVVIDMAQSAGLVPCNVGLETIDFAVFAGHKTLYGPTGISGFVMNPNIGLAPVLFGGTGFESANQDMPQSLPERFEMGTMNSMAIAGLNASLKWIEEVGGDTIRKIEEENRKKLIDLLSEYSFVRIVGNDSDNKHVGVVSVLLEGLSSDSCGSIFDRLGIAVRTGLQCAPLAHMFLGTYPAGTVRFSVGVFTTEEDFMKLREALDYIQGEM